MLKKKKLNYLFQIELSLKRSEKNTEDFVANLEKEINIDFQRAMNKINFDKIINSKKEAFSFVTIPPSFYVKKDTPEKGCIAEIPKYDFDAQYYSFSFVSLLTRKEVIEALSRVRVECNRVSSMCLFQIPNKQMKLEEFEQSQTQQIAQVLNYTFVSHDILFH
jgi:dynein heavy chain, axonemal